MHLKNLILAAAVSIFLFNNASAQPAQRGAGVTGLALEVVYLKGTPPAYNIVLTTFVKRRGSWFGRFGRVAGWQLPSGSSPVGAVRFVPYLDGERVKVEVSVLRGENLKDEDKIASYSLRENEQARVTELESFGVEPFEIKVVRVVPSIADLPVTLSKIKSLEVVGVEAVRSTFPRYKITLRNLADKNISALRLNVMGDGRIKISGMQVADDDKPLIRAGDFCEVTSSLDVRAQATAGGYTPAPPIAQQFVIVTVIYEDGSYEGEPEAAAMYLASVLGNRTELRRIVKLLENASAADSASTPEAIRAQLNSLTDEVADKDLDSLAKIFPSCDRLDLKTSAGVSIQELRKDLLDQLQRFAPGTSVSASEFKTWLGSAKERYSDWLSRLKSAGLSKQ